MTTVEERYRALVAEGRFEADPEQIRITQKFDALIGRVSEARLASKGSALGWLFNRKAPVQDVRGLYIWGSVGRGKTMLMDLFYEALPFHEKRRAHFHAFMGEVHERIFAWRQAAKAGTVKGNDPIQPVAENIACDLKVLCFDEFSVTDIADAMLLGRLFEALFARGVVIVATSNVEPVNLYKDGLNRALFLPFIAMLGQKLEVVKLDARTDYRLEKLAGASVYLVPDDMQARAALDAIFARLSGVATGHPVTLAIKGRAVTVPKAAHGVGMISFQDLCERALGAGDYLAIAQDFHTLLVYGVPILRQDTRNEAKRFITLIDVLYDNNVKVVISAAVPAQELYQGHHGVEVFEFDRTVSRLIEMRSEEYLAKPHGRDANANSGDSTGLVET